MEVYDITANAKINLFLRICGKLPNGYHRLYTVMQEIDVADEVRVSIDDNKETGISVICDGFTDTDQKKNLCYKAADRFYANYHNKLVEDGYKNKIRFPYTEIALKKTIPFQAGMGGGSSDAAAILLVLQEHFGNPFSEEELNRIAVNIGADVPFFLYGGTCLCEGVGEEITQLEGAARWPVLIVKPPKGVSTPRSFAQVDKTDIPAFDTHDYEKMFTSLREAGDDADKVRGILKEYKHIFVNDLQAPGIEEVPVISDIITSLDDEGSMISLMTGSGSAVFGIFASEEEAKRASGVMSEAHQYKDCQFIVTKMV